MNGTTETVTKGVAIRTVPPRVRRIFHELRQQCEDKMNSDPLIMKDTGLPYCERTADSWGGCWPDTAAGDISRIACPDLPLFNTNEFAYRQCTENGTWLLEGSRKTYTSCRNEQSLIDEDVKYIYIFIGGFAVSLITLFVSLMIFYSFRQLRCDRITIHKNLFLSYVFTGMSWILYYVFVALEGVVLMNNPVWCRVLHVACQYFTVCNFSWMFCEGLYLNAIMVYAFSSGKTLILICYSVGWGIPVVLTAIYIGIRNHSDLESLDCWYVESKLQWILYGPVVLSIVINVIFLINIVRLLVTKLRQMPEVTQTNEEEARIPVDVMSNLTNPTFVKNRTLSTWKATRATLILVPLLGLQYILFPIRPPEGSSMDVFYHTAVALLVSLQGAFVSIMYCFCNSEVLSVMSRKYTQRRLMRKRSSVKSTSGQPGTIYTTIDHVSAQTNYCALYKEMNRDKMQLESEDC